jgi:hypothetical protein
VLLYVGISMTPWERFRQHRQGKPWWDDIVSVTMEHYPSREEVLTAERSAIVEDHPRHNIQHNASRIIGPDGGPIGRPTKWRFSSQESASRLLTVTSRTGMQTVGEFELVYEVELDPISDDYYWDDVDPKQLFNSWVKQVERKHGTDGFVPIYWFVSGPCLFESAHLEQHGYESPRGGFLSYYREPVDANGRTIPLDELPVQAKKWSAKQCDKGGFLPVATGWTPSAFQHEVSIQMLKSKARRRHWAICGRNEWELVAS